MDDERDLPTADRVMHLLRHPGIARAHFVRGDVAVAEEREATAGQATLDERFDRRDAAEFDDEGER